MITEMLTRLIRPDLPNNWESSIHVPKIAWKTGTSYGRRDAWSIGYNKKYTIAVWTGNFDGEGVPELTGADMSTPLLFELFNALDYDSGESWYAVPGEVDFRLVCSSSGLLPGSFCTDLVTDYYIPAVSPTIECPFEKEISLSSDGHLSYCMLCRPENGFKKEIFSIFPPAVHAFYANNGINFRQPPPHNPGCSRIFSGRGPEITSPINNKEYLLEKSADQQLLLNCTGGADIQWVYWFINDRFHQKAKAGESVYFTPSQGLNKISCSDDLGRNTNCKVDVKFY
jgi:penicillin-binding protein 1C